MKKSILFLVLLLLMKFSFAQTLKVGTQSIPSSQSLSIASGILEQELKKINVKLEVFNFDTGRDINNALASKSIDVGFLGATPYVAGILSGLEVDVFHIGFISKKNEGLCVKPNFNTISELKGKTLGVPFGTSAHYALLSALNINKISQSEVKLFDLNPTDLFAAWQRNDIQGAFVWDITLSALENCKLVYSDEDLFNAGIILGDINVLRRDYGNKNAPIIQAYVRALDTAYELYKNNRQEAINILANYFKLDYKEIQKMIHEDKALWLNSQALKDLKLLGTSEQKGEFSKTLQNIAEFLHSQGILRKIPKDIVFESYINPNFLQ